MERQTEGKQEFAQVKLVPNGASSKAVEERKWSRNGSRRFEVSCRAGNAGHLEVASDEVSVRIGQRVRREGQEEFWGSVLVECKEQTDGSLAVDVVVFHPDWDEPLRIASIQSNRSSKNGLEQALRCDFEQKRL